MINFTAIFNKPVLTSTLLLFSIYSFSQKNDSLVLSKIKEKVLVNGAVTITNNGISVIPTFMLGKPATIFDLVIRKNRFSFEPQFRFAIEDFKPWSFIFWMRYKLTDTQKFKMGIGIHPSTVFQNTIISINGVSKDAITVRRFWAGDLNPTFVLSKNVSVGVYYLYSRGLADATKNTNFVALSGNFSNIKLGSDISMKIAPQVYYLRMDDIEGYYATSSFTLVKKDFPFTISSIINKKIQSEIPSEDFVWNVSLIYSY
jgi:hypothetical protein